MPTMVSSSIGYDFFHLVNDLDSVGVLVDAKERGFHDLYAISLWLENKVFKIGTPSLERSTQVQVERFHFSFLC